MSKGVIFVFDRDDFVEVIVLVYNVRNRRLDRVRILKNLFDVFV